MFLSHYQHIMTSVVILCFASVLLFIQAKPCNYSQNCLDCDKTGYCTSRCHPGYFGKRCTSKCSNGCRYKSCELHSDGGIEACTNGCISGFQGPRCNIPCDENWKQCTECKGGCVGKYCQLGSSCVSGCVDSYYGLDCKNCSEQCKSCNRSTGICDKCHSPYTGPNCEMSCENCKGTCKAGCEEGCNRGFYGHWCEKVCSENCRAGPGACDRNASKNCSPECGNSTGFCIHSCNSGWYGANCSTQCNPRCVNMSCTDSGACVAGCAPGYAGSDCSCFETCKEHICFSENGTCAKGCTNGYYGAFCNTSCEVCTDGICDQESGTCTKGCNITDQRCKSTCSGDCPIDTCVKENTCGKTYLFGFYGHWCEKVCSQKCRAGPHATSVPAFARNTPSPNNCILECDNYSGDRIHGCNVGWYCTNCSSRYNSKCVNMSCTDLGACVDDCTPRKAGSDCSCFGTALITNVTLRTTCGICIGEPTTESLPLIIIGTSSACCLVGIMIAVCIGCYERTKRQETDDKEEEYPVGQPEAPHYELMDIDPDKNETGPVIVFL